MDYSKINIEKFTKYLMAYGCEILPPTNQYELLRFKGKSVGIIYTSGKVNSKYTSNAINCYRKGLKWNGGPVNTGRKKSYKKQKIKLLERDGTKCFFCDKELGDDITLEHLISLNQGGKNELSNMVLAHEKCNQDASHLPLNEKVNIAVKNRIANYGK